VSGPRDPKAVENSRRERAEIRRVWLELVQRNPFRRVTADLIRSHLPFQLARSTVYWHMEAIRAEAELERCNSSDSSERTSSVG
jgi:hypothetical protein